MIRPVVTHTGAAVFGAIISYGVLELSSKYNYYKNDDNKYSTTTQIIPPIRHPITLFHPNPNLTIAYDSRTKVPSYVVERIIRPKDTGALVARNRMHFQFYEESSNSLPPHQRSRNSYYHKSGYDKGHMAPASNYKHSADEMRDTFCLTNVAPQVPVLNRVIMSRLEELTRKLALDHLEKNEDNNKDETISRSAFIITGPMFLPNQSISRTTDQKRIYEYHYKGIGDPPSIIHVPTHFFKMVLIFKEDDQEDDSSSTSFNGVLDQFAAWVIPNNEDFFQRMILQDDAKINLQDFLVRPSDIEAVTGLQFFSGDASTTNDGPVMKVLDILTERVWREHGRLSKVSLLTDGSYGEEDDMEYGSSKAKRAKERQQLRKLDDGNHLPSHICTGGKCSHMIKMSKSSIVAK